MTTEVKNLYFPVPRHEANTLASLNMTQSYEAGTLNFVPTMAPMLPGEAGRRLESDKAEETLEELDESLEYIKCVGRCKRKMDVLTHAQRLRLNAVSKGAHGDALYGRTPRGGGSLHGAHIAQRARARRADLERARARRDSALRQEGFDEARSEQAAARSESAKKGQLTRQRRNRMRNDLIREGFFEAADIPSSELEDYFNSVRQELIARMSRRNIDRREKMSLSTDPNAERQEQSFAHSDAGGRYRPPEEPLGMEEALEDIDRGMEDLDLVVPGDPGESRLPSHFETFGGLTEPEGPGLLP